MEDTRGEIYWPGISNAFGFCDVCPDNTFFKLMQGLGIANQKMFIFGGVEEMLSWSLFYSLSI